VGYCSQYNVNARIAPLKPTDKVVLIGYSGGGFAVTQIADDLNGTRPHKIDPLVAFDMGKKVAKAICYCNSMPLMLGLGGTAATGLLREARRVMRILELQVSARFTVNREWAASHRAAS